MSIATKSEIKRLMRAGMLKIYPSPRDEHIGPNSIDLHLHPEMFVYISAELDARSENHTKPVAIPEGGLVLRPGEFYIARTVEETHTPYHVPFLSGRSSTGRLGIEVHCTAGLGDIGFKGTWTLEISVKKPVRVYPGMRIAQLWLHTVVSESGDEAYTGRYQGQKHATPSRMHQGEATNHFSDLDCLGERWAQEYFQEIEDKK